MKNNKDQNIASVIEIEKNPFIKMMEDKKRIVKAIKEGQSLSTLKGIKVASPL